MMMKSWNFSGNGWPGKISPNVIERLFIEFAEQMTSTNAVIGKRTSQALA